MRASQYLTVLFCLATVLTGGVIVVNAHVDPYGLASAVKDSDLSADLERARAGAFWRNAFAVRDMMPRTIILGTSRARTGIDPLDRGFAPEFAPMANLSLGALSIEQIRLLLIHAQTKSPLTMAVIGLDLESFLDDGRPDFDPAALRGNPQSEPEALVRLRIDVSRETLSASLAKWMDGPPDTSAGPRGVDPRSRGITDADLRDFEGQRGIVWAAEFANFYGRLPNLFPPWRPGTRWETDPRRAAAMKSFRELLQYARSHGIELRMFISPVHARYLEWYQRTGWWPLFEAWKRALVVAIDEEAKDGSGRPAFVLWDFSGFHQLAREPVPRLGDLSTRMRWYRDTSHYSPELGDLILEHILGGHTGSGSPLPDIRIDRATIERQLTEIRTGAAEFRRDQPGEAANVGEMLAYLRRVGKK